MEKFVVEAEYTVTATRRVEKKVDANSAEEAEQKIKEAIEQDKGCIVTKLSSKSIKYNTEDWQDVEDIIFMYDEWIKEEEEAGDKEMVDMHKADRADWQYILDQLVDKEFKKAAERYEGLDTCVRERIPDRIWGLFDNLGLI